MAVSAVSRGVTSVAWTKEMDLGHGFDVLASSLHGAPVVQHDLQPKSSTSGQRTSFALTVVESSKELHKALGVSVQGSLQMGVYSVDGKAEFAAGSTVDSSSVYLLVSVKVEDRVEQFDPDALQALHLVPAAEELYVHDPVTFRRRYGSHLITGRETGGELHCLMAISTSSEDDKLSLSAQLSGTYGEFSAQGKVDAALSKSVKDRRVTIRIYKWGGVPLTERPEDLTVDAFVAMSGRFAAEVRDNPQPYAAVLTPYDELVALPGQSVPAVAIDAAEADVERMGELCAAYDDLVADVQYMYAHGDEFQMPKVNEAELRRIKTAVEAERHRVVTEIGRITADPASAPSKTLFKSVDELTGALPQRLKRLPRSALEFKQAYPGIVADGEYDIFPTGDVRSRVTVYCAGMQGTAPKEFITLPAGPESNYSEVPASPVSEGQCWCFGQTVRTSYSRIRFHPESWTVDVEDQTFAKTKGSVTETNKNREVVRKIDHVPFATTRASNHVMNADHQPRTPFGTAKVDLRGTPFRVADGVEWVPEGWDVKPSSAVQRPTDARRQVVELEIGGAPGAIAPKGGLRLAPVDSRQVTK